MTHTPRRDGWSPALQRNFLELLAEGGVVRAAAAACGMSARAAYALRLSPRGAAFRIGWDAALLVARARLADALMERAIEGQADIITREGDVATRHRHDNRLGLAMLARLDRLAECDQPAGSDAALARIVAQDFAAFLDLVDPAPALPAPLPADPALSAPAPADAIDRDAPAMLPAVDAGPGAAALALFLAVRQPLIPCELRPETGLDEADDEDLPHADPPPPSADEALGRLQGVWREDGIWRTDFPPPPGYDGDEEGAYGDPGYSRDLTVREAAAQDALHAAALAPAIAATAAARDAHFGFRPPRRPRCRAAASRRAPAALDHAPVPPRAETPTEVVARYIADWDAREAAQAAEAAAAAPTSAIVTPSEPAAPPAPAPEPIVYPAQSDVQTHFPVYPDPGPVRRHPLCARAPWYAY